MKKTIVILLAGGAIFCLVLASKEIISRYKRIDPVADIHTKSEIKVDEPVNLEIPALEINLPIESENILPSGWPISDKALVHISSTTIFYGHNWPNILGKIKDIRPGSQIAIKYGNNSRLNYSVSLVTEVFPNDDKILQSIKLNQIVIYTCSGILDSKRLVVIADQEI